MCDHNMPTAFQASSEEDDSQFPEVCRKLQFPLSNKGTQNKDQAIQRLQDEVKQINGKLDVILDMLGKVLNENSKLKGKTQKENQEALVKILKAAPFTFTQSRLMQEPVIGNKRRRED